MFIGLPVRDDALPQTKATIEAILKRHGGSLYAHIGCPWVDIARTEIVARFLQTKETHLLWVDADNWFDPFLADGMLGANSPIVTCTYRKRFPPHAFCATPLGNQTPHIRRWREAPMRAVDGMRLVEIESNGLGCTLVQRHVIEHLVEAHPELSYANDAGRDRRWIFQPFVEPDADGIPRMAGDDRAFFIRARRAGFKVECLIDETVWHDGIEGNFARDVFDRASA